MPKRMKLKGGTNTTSSSDDSDNSIVIVIVLAIIACIFLLVVGAVVYYFFIKDDDDETPSPTPPPSTPSGTSPSAAGTPPNTGDSPSRNTGEPSTPSSPPGPEPNWSEGSGKNCFYADSSITGARRNINRDGNEVYNDINAEQCKRLCVATENCNCISHQPSDNSCYLRNDCDFDHCPTSSDYNSYILTNKPNYLVGYDDTNWSSNSGANCFVGSGAEEAITNTYNNLDHSKNILDHCKRTCFEDPECNCITYHTSDNLCYMRKNCSISSCAQGTVYDTYTYTEGSSSQSTPPGPSGPEPNWSEGSGKNCYYSDSSIVGARKNVRNPDIKYSNVSIDECKDMCASDENCNCISHQPSDNSCYLRNDCDFDHCPTSSDYNSYILTNKPNYLVGYDDTNWSSNSGANCFVGSGAEEAITNTYNNLDHSKNILDHCKRTCFEDPECNCITYHTSDNLCYMRKNCSISSCAQGTDYDTYTYT